MKVLRQLAVFWVLFIRLACPADADTVIFANGDRVSGKELLVDAEVVNLTSATLGVLKVPREQVREVATDEAVSVTFSDGPELRGTLISAAGPGWMRLRYDDGNATVAFPFTSIVAIRRVKGGKAVEPWRTNGNVNLGANWKSGTTDTESFSFDGKAEVRKGRHRTTARGEANYRKEAGDQTANNVLTQLQHDTFFRKRWYSYGNGAMEYDSEKELDLRFVLGTGFGYQIVDSARASLSVEGGPSYVWERYSTGLHEEYPAARWAVDARLDPILEKIRLFHHHEVFAGIGRGGVSLRSRTGVRYFLFDGLNATGQVNYEWDSNPVLDQNQTEIAYLVTLGYAW